MRNSVRRKRGDEETIFKKFFHYQPSSAGEYRYQNVKRWSKKVPGKDIFALDKVIYPVNMSGAHWTCVVIFMKVRDCFSQWLYILIICLYNQGIHSLSPNTLPGEISKISDKNGKIALHHAVKNGASKEVIRCLIESSPESMTVQDNHKNAPLHAYLKNEKLEGSLSSSTISMLLSPIVASSVDRKNRTSLYLAVIAKKLFVWRH